MKADRRVIYISLGVALLTIISLFTFQSIKLSGGEKKVVKKQNYTTEKSIPKEIMDKIKIYKFNAFFGKDNLKNLKNFDIIFRSPSCLPTKPELLQEIERGAIVTTEIEMLMKMCPCKIIGVTGSDRKDNNNKFD